MKIGRCFYGKVAGSLSPSIFFLSSGWLSDCSTLFNIIRQYSDTDAKGLLTACLYAFDKFRDGVKPEDDVTLVVIKVTDT